MVKEILRVGLHQPVQVLEADLVSILKDLLEARTSGNTKYRARDS